MKLILRSPFVIIRRKYLDEMKSYVSYERSESKKLIEKYQKDVDTLQRNLDFWKREFKKRAPAKKCTRCREKVDLWPFESDGYYIDGNRVTHARCMSEETTI